MAPVPLIIDTDPGIDDIIAIVLALDRPDLVQLKAITLTFGNATLDHCHNNMIQLFNILQKHIAENPSESHRAKLAKTFASSPIILSQGATGPLGGQRFTASYFHGRDGVSGITTLPGNPWPLPSKIPEPLQETEKAAHDVILDTIRSNPPGTVRIAAVGPLTNIALAWQKDPETFAKVGGISVMGAALDVPGNTTPCAEFNTFADPFAAKELLHNAPLHPILRKQGKRLPVDLLPLDITTQHLVPFARLCGDKVENKGILQKYLAAILVSPRKAMNSYADPDKPFDPAVNDLFQCHDPLAVGHAIFCPSPVQRLGQLPDNEKMINQNYEGWQMKTREFGIETDGSLTRGFCVVDRRAHGKVKAGHSRVEKEAPVSGTKEESTKVAPKENGKEEEEKPTKGAWDVLITSPGIEWFGEQLCKALNV